MNGEPIFLTLPEVMEIHQYQVETFGGAVGVRDIHLLQSAVGVPASTFGGAFLHPTIFAMAAAYLYHIVENHPFVDGNKRTGAMAALIFLEMNDVEFSAPEQEFTSMVLQVASGKMSKPEVASFLEKYSCEK